MPLPVAFTVDGGAPVVLARGLAVAALLSLLGTLAFRAWVLPRVAGAMPAAVAPRVGRGLQRLAAGSLAAALVAGAAWLLVQTADMAGAQTAPALFAAVPTVLGQTAFGHVLLLQAAALLVAAAALGSSRRWADRVGLGSAAAACALQAGHGHGAAMAPGVSWLLGMDVVHLLAAGVWLGGLLPLVIVVWAAPAKAGALAARWFSPLGKVCVVAIAASAAYQGWVLVGSVPGLVGTGYGWVAGAKLGLFAVLFGFALANRYRLAPALLRADPAGARARLLRSLAAQTGFGVATVAAAAVLSGLSPAMHEQAVWPFANRFTLDTLGEDPAFRTEVLLALLALGVAGALAAAALALRRRWRWALLVPGVLIAYRAVPHLDLLFVPAYPTSFFHSPSQFAAGSVMAGLALYPQHCAVCHGASGHGDGPAARTLPVPPADLTAGHLWMHADGELFWWLTHGIEAPEGGLAMPGFAAVLTEEQRWALIDAIRARNAGLHFAAAGGWLPPLQAPGLQAVCDGGRVVTLADLRGSFVRVVLGPGHALPGVVTVLAAASAEPGPGLCVTADPAVVAAYALVAGGAPAGSEFLVDGDGWLRATQRPDADGGWDDPAVLQADIDRFRAQPITAASEAMDSDMPM